MSKPNIVLPRAAKYDGTHKALAEELLQPNFCHNDMSRTQMFTSHFPQSVVLNNPEIPRVYTNFENHIGKYTSANVKLSQNATIVSVFNYSALKTYYLLQFEDGTFDIHTAEPVKHLSEKFGYRYNNSRMDGVGVGDTIEQDEVIRSWPCNDESGNLQYGTNLKTVFMFYKGKTYEDAIIASETAAKTKLAHTSVVTMDVMVNPNDILVDTQGKGDTHKGFSDIGEDIVDGMLAVRRRIEHSSIINNLTDENLRTVFAETDTIFHASGTIVDIEIFNNNSNIENIDKMSVYKQIKKYYTQQILLAKWLSENLTDINTKPELYSSQCAFLYRRYVEENFNWEHNDTKFDGIMIRFTIAKTQPATTGSKLATRHGGKGVLSMILPDDEMPLTVDGERADIICNAGGVFGRMNLGQLYEHELAHGANQIWKRMKADLPNAESIYREFIDHVTPDAYSEFLDATKESYPEEYAMFIDTIVETGFIPIHQPPMNDTIGLDGLREMYSKFNIEKIGIVGVEEPLIFGDMYFIKLRHEPASKHSVRSASHLSVTGLPAKNNRNYKAGTEHHSSTAIRLGEQEMQNLLLASDREQIGKFIRVLSTDSDARRDLITKFLKDHPFLTKELKVKGSGSNAVTGLKSFFNSIGIDLTDTDAEFAAKCISESPE